MGGAWLWAQREIRRGWGSLLIVALLVAFAGGAVMAGLAGARRAASSVDRFAEASSLAELTLFTQGARIDDQLRSDLEADPRIEAMAELRIVMAAVDGLTPGIDGVMLVVPDRYWGELVRPRVVAGRLPVGPNEIALPETTSHDSSLGDDVALNVLAGEQLDACFGGGDCDWIDVGDVTVVGKVRLADDLAPSPYENNLLIASESFVAARGGDEITFGYVIELFTASGVDLDAIVADYSVRIEDGDLVDASANDVAGARRAVDVQRDALVVASLIVAGAGLLIAGQAFGRFLTRRPSDASTLSSVGMTSGQRVIAGWTPGLAAALTGAILTVPIAVLLAWAFPRGIARRADPDVGFHADWVVLAPGMAVTFAAGACCALAAAMLWSRTTPPRPVGSVTAASAFVQRFRLPPVAAMGFQFALDPGRGSRRTPAIPGLIGTAAAVAVLIGAVTFHSSLDGLLTTPSRYGVPWDIHVAAWGADEPAEFGERVAGDGRVDAVALAVGGELNVGTNGSPPVQGFAIGMSSVKGSVAPAILDGRAPGGPNEVLLGTDTFERLQLSLEDEVEISGPHGERTMVVVGRAILPILGGQNTDSGVVVPLQTMLDLGGTETVADIDVELAVFVSVSAGADVAAVERDLVSSGAMLGEPLQQSSVTVLGELRTILVYIGGFVLLLGSLAAFHALYVTAQRRRNVLAVLRALGHRPGQVAAVIRWQGCATALVALLIGTPLGFIGGRVLWRSTAEETNVVVVVDVPWPLLGIIATASVFGTSVGLAAWPAWSARHRNPAHDLRAE